VKNLPIGAGRTTLYFRCEKQGVEVGLSDVEGDIRLMRA